MARWRVILAAICLVLCRKHLFLALLLPSARLFTPTALISARGRPWPCGTPPTEIPTDTDRSSWCRARRRFLADRRRRTPGHTTAGRYRSGFGQNRHRCASRGQRWHWPAYCEPLPYKSRPREFAAYVFLINNLRKARGTTVGTLLLSHANELVNWPNFL